MEEERQKKDRKKAIGQEKILIEYYKRRITEKDRKKDRRKRKQKID